MKQGDRFSLTVDTIDSGGHGVAEVDEHKVLVPSVAPGDELLVTIDHVSDHRNVAWASVVSIVTRGPGYRAVSCPCAVQAGGTCTGCPLMHLDNNTQDAAKTDNLRQTFAAAEISQIPVWRPTEYRLGYRNRSNFVYGQGEG
ncbi:MAG: hypothetical protein JRF33_27690, partial [Deltaproteobacteria bacterium]|nr:hypothetical protein [Deltaproteobacteria bacterium]